MCDIEYDYCKARILRLSRLLFLFYFLLKTDYKHVELILNVRKIVISCYNGKSIKQFKHDWLFLNNTKQYSNYN